MLFAVLFSLFYSVNSNAQCDIEYNISGNLNETCFISGNDIQLDYTPGGHFGWRIDSLGGPQNIVFNFGNSGSYTWMTPPSGTYIIYALDNFAQEICSDTIIISNGPLILDDAILSYCVGNTISLSNILSENYLQNGGINPQFSFSIGGTSINGIYTIDNIGITTINATILSTSGCIDSSIITINADTTNIIIQNYTIEDINGNENVIQACDITDITFSVDSPNPNFTYTWIVDSDTTNNPNTLTLDGSNYDNPGIIPIILQITINNSNTSKVVGM